MKFPFHPGDILTERRPPSEASAAQSDFAEMGRLCADAAHLAVNNQGGGGVLIRMGRCCDAVSAQVVVTNAEQHWKKKKLMRLMS